MTATTAIPLAVRTGLPLSIGVSLSLCDSGRAARISTILGILASLFYAATLILSFDRLICSPRSYAAINRLTISLIVLIVSEGTSAESTV